MGTSKAQKMGWHGDVKLPMWPRGCSAWGVARKRPRTSPAVPALLYSAPQSTVPGRHLPGNVSHSAGTARCPFLGRQTWPSWHSWPPQMPATTSCPRNAQRLVQQIAGLLAFHYRKPWRHKHARSLRRCTCVASGVAEVLLEELVAKASHSARIPINNIHVPPGAGMHAC